MLEEHNTAWEYCELWLVEAEWNHKKQQWSYDCSIRYHTVDGAAPRQLALPDQPLTINPFAKAMALLGAAGWEMVSAQHGNTANGDIYWWKSRVAYFKRPVVAGRAITEPELVI